MDRHRGCFYRVKKERCLMSMYVSVCVVVSLNVQT